MEILHFRNRGSSRNGTEGTGVWTPLSPSCTCLSISSMSRMMSFPLLFPPCPTSIHLCYTDLPSPLFTTPPPPPLLRNWLLGANENCSVFNTLYSRKVHKRRALMVMQDRYDLDSEFFFPHSLSLITFTVRLD